jgi:hypothetical protein
MRGLGQHGRSWLYMASATYADKTAQARVPVLPGRFNPIMQSGRNWYFEGVDTNHGAL